MYAIIESKLDPLRERLTAEFHQSPEYIAKQEHERIIADHMTAQNEFCSKYDVDKDEYNRSLCDTIPDPAAEAAILGVDRREDLRRLHAALEAAIASLPFDLQAAIRGRYYRGEVVNANAHNKAMRMLRAPKCAQALRAYL